MNNIGSSAHDEPELICGMNKIINHMKRLEEEINKLKEENNNLKQNENVREDKLQEVILENKRLSNK